MDWLGFVGSIIGGLIGGLFTFFGVKLTIRHEDRIKKAEDYKNLVEERPRFELVSFKDINEVKSKKNVDLSVLFLKIKDVKINRSRIKFIYNEECIDNNKLVCIEYTFKNIGATEIDAVSLCSNFSKDTSLIDYDNRELYIKEKLLNYSVDSKRRFIKSNETITIRIYYHSDEIILGAISASLTIYMQDINGRYWAQPLFAPSKEIENSRLSSFKEFKENSNIELALKCFEGKELW